MQQIKKLFFDKIPFLSSKMNPFSHVNLTKDSFDKHLSDCEGILMQCKSIRTRLVAFNIFALGTLCREQLFIFGLTVVKDGRTKPNKQIYIQK